MTIRPDIAEFVTRVEMFSKRRLNYPLEVSEILQIAVQTGLTDEFEELIFQTKFLTRTQDVMKKIGNEAEGLEKLVEEFDSVLKKSVDLLKTLVGRVPTDVMQKYSDLFFVVETESLARLIKLYSDLSWIKNWQIDGKPLPYETKSQIVSIAQGNINLRTQEKQQDTQSRKSLSQIQIKCGSYGDPDGTISSRRPPCNNPWLVTFTWDYSIACIYCYPDSILN